MNTRASQRCLGLIGLIAIAATAQAADWPCFRGDPQRSAVTAEKLEFRLRAAWVFTPVHPPSPAYVKSVRMQEEGGFAAKRGARAQQGTFEPATHDYSFYPIIRGGRVFYASSTDEGLHCLDAATGKPLWSFYTEGAIRLAPHAAGDRVYAGSDDGKVYCLNAADGREIWSARSVPKEECCIGQNRPISAWPVRGGVVVEDGKVFAGAGMFPQQDVRVCSLDAATGRMLAQQSIRYVAAGPAMLDGELLWMPTHRTTPTMIRRETLMPVYPNSAILLSRGASQVFKVAGLTAWGPDEAGLIYMVLQPATPVASLDKIGRDDSVFKALGVVTLLYGTTALADDDTAVIVGDTEVIALARNDFLQAAGARAEAVLAKREEATVAPAFGKYMGAMGSVDSLFENRLSADARWRQPTPRRFGHVAAILAGEHLILGSENKLTALNKRDGRTVWTADVDGTPWGLAAANGALYAATDKGLIYSFQPGTGATARPDPARKNPFAADAKIADAVRTAVAQAGRTNGFCVITGENAGAYAREVARQSEFFTIIFEADAARARQAREQLVQAGLNGARAVVRHLPNGLGRRYPLGIANLALVLSGATVAPGELMRLVQPYGGTLALPAAAAWSHPEFAPVTAAGPWTILRRGHLTGAGQWTHGGGSPANTMSSDEQNLPADGADFRLQWFGAPYAYDIVDRHAVPVTPQYQNGILFVPGRTNSLTAVDAYNGTILWVIHQPDSLRMMASHNASPIACAGDGRHVFAVTSDECWLLDAVTGQKKAAFKAQPGWDWGYAGSVDNILVGTSQGKEVDRLAAGLLGGKNRKFLQTDAWQTSLVSAGKEIFAADYTTGRRLWTYDRRLVLNPTICIADGKVFFGESRNAVALANTTGYINMSDWIANGAQVTALDLRTGQSVWELPLTRNIDAPFQWLMHLAWKDGILLKTRTYFVRKGSEVYRGYDVEGLEANTGKSLWQRWLQGDYPGEARGLAYGKNSLTSWPVIVGDRFYIKANIFLRNNANAAISGYHLRTGEEFLKPKPAGIHHPGCSPALGAAHAIYYRSYHHVAMDLKDFVLRELTWVTRPSCWPNTLPAGGLLLAPEGGSGCSCGLSYQLSFALAPKDK